MKSETYTDLFEDEIAEVLRSHPDLNAITDAHREFYPARMICEDGVYTSGSGLFSVYMDGKRTGSHVSAQYIASALAHETFRVYTRS